MTTSALSSKPKSILHLDFETRSTLDLKKVGLHNYADPKFTEVLCLAWAFDDEPVQLIAPRWFEPKTQPRMLDHIFSGGSVWAHNATFEFQIWNKIFCPILDLKLEQMTCTMAMAYAMGLPGNLDGAAASLGISFRKDLEGSRIMRQLCQPKDIDSEGNIIWWDNPEKYEKLYAYCKQDVAVEREIGKRLMQLTPYEQSVWRLDQRINSRGITVDKIAVTSAVKMVEDEKNRLNQLIREKTNNRVATCNAVQQIKDYLEFFGVAAERLDKPSVQELIVSPATNPHAKEILHLRSLGGKAATAKLEPMLNGIGSDNRLRGCFQYSGANTRRWAGRRVQLHNLKRPGVKHEEIEKIINQITDNSNSDILRRTYGSVLNIIGDCTRAFLTAAPGCELITCDFNAIEARVLAWLAGQDDKLDIFKRGEDLYLIAASRIFGIKITDKEDIRRLVGKVAELALGYQGGVGAFQQMARAYNVKMESAFKELWATADFDTQSFSEQRYQQAGGKYEISREEFLASEITKINWRQSNHRICEYWVSAEEGFLRAIFDPGSTQTIGKGNRIVAFKKSGSFLWCRLPSGGVICYPYPEIKATKTPWGSTKDLPTYMAEDGQSHKWQRFSTYGGSIVENITQAVARDLLADAMLRLENANYKIVAHVHDEIICEMPCGEGSLDVMEKIMSQNPSWAFDLPVVAKGWRGFRYRK